MDLYNELCYYLQENLIKFSETEKGRLVTIDGLTYELFEPFQYEEGEPPIFFDDYFAWANKKTEYDRYIFRFGGCWYWFVKGEERSPSLNRVKYLGEADFAEEDLRIPYFLGVHGPFEMMNTCGLYSMWAKKAKFLGIKKLGICERGHLAGTFKFQAACKKEGIDPIFGMEVPLKDESNDTKSSLKLFAEDEGGWHSLLMLNKSINIDNGGFTDYDTIVGNNEGLICILDPKSMKFEDIPIGCRKLFEGRLYYELDTVVYEKESRDKEYLENLKKYFQSSIPPIAMYDAYYVDKEYRVVREKLNRLANIVNYESKNQYFKSNQEYFLELQTLFNENDFDRFLDVFIEAESNLADVCEKCCFTIETAVRHLPRYIMTEEEKKLYPDTKTMFEELIFEGVEKHPELIERYGEDIVGDRIDKEIETIEGGDLVDYFLVLRDIINWAETNNILLGAGRGSGAGSLVNYLLGLTKVDPLRFHLLFERFLNEGRLFRQEKNEVIVCQGDNDQEYILDPKKTYKVSRRGIDMSITGDLLQVGDVIDESEF